MSGFFANVVAEPPNNILGLALECSKDPAPEKINLTIGAYRTNDGKPYVMPCVRKAEEQILADNVNHEYLNQDGLDEFRTASQKLFFGANSPLIEQGRIYTIQSVAGTGMIC